MLRVRPDDAELHDDVALLYLRTGQRERAADHFQTSLSIKSASASAHFNYATALTVSGRVDEAIESYRRALAIDPRHSHAHNNLGSVLSALRDYVGALRTSIARSRSTPPTPRRTPLCKRTGANPVESARTWLLTESVVDSRDGTHFRSGGWFSHTR